MRVCCPVFSKKKETLALYITLPHWVYSHGCRGGCHPACHTHTQPTHRVNTGRPNPWNGRDQPDPSQWDEPDQPDPNPWGGCCLQAADPTQTHRPRPIPGPQLRKGCTVKWDKEGVCLSQLPEKPSNHTHFFLHGRTSVPADLLRFNPLG